MRGKKIERNVPRRGWGGCQKKAGRGNLKGRRRGREWPIRVKVSDCRKLLGRREKCGGVTMEIYELGRAGKEKWGGKRKS